MSYCNLCQGIIPWFVNGFKDLDFLERYWDSEDLDYEHHSTISDLQNASQDGCPVCKMIFGILSEVQVVNRRLFEDQETKKPLILRFVYGGTDTWSHKTLSYEGSCPGFSVKLQFYSIPSPKIIPLISVYSNHLSSNPLTAVTELYGGITNECILRHPDCNMETVQGYLPKILISVGSREGSRDPFLIETKDLRLRDETGEIGAISYDTRHAQYATLSHCWGSGPYLCNTTQANLSWRKDKIEMSTLNRTFQDAITVTKALGVGYLWIDSLCIIQDSPDDWESQSAMMSFVYNNAFINISATSANNGNEGFLRERIPGVELPLSPGFSSPHLERTNLWIRLASPPEDGPLDSRGWVLQEIVLARRTLSFGHHETSFRCRTHQRAERNGFAPEKNTTYEKHLKFTEMLHNGIETASEFKEAFEMWHRMVEIYSEKLLSYHTDKLPAISGLSLHFAGEMEDKKYVAGLWRADLPAGLCWFVRPGGAGGRFNDYVAPSWSWASQSGMINYVQMEAEVDFHCQVLDMGAELLGNRTYNYHGRICDAFLKVKGKMLEGLVLKASEENFCEAWREGEKLGYALMDDTSPLPSEKLWYLILGHHNQGLEEQTSEGEIRSSMGLLLKQMKNELDVFQRVGYCFDVGSLFAMQQAKEMVLTIK